MTLGDQSRTVFVAAAMYLPEEISGPCALVVERGRVQAVLRGIDPAAVLSGDRVVDLRPWRLAPGYIDLHTHGFAGHDVTTGSDTDLQAMAKALPATGVTAFFPTIASTGPADTRRQVERIASAMHQAVSPSADILGIRLEGPFINRAKKGAQNPAAIRRPDAAELTLLAERGPVRIVDFAPEEDHDFELLAALVQHGIVPCIGHTAATYEQTIAALDAGARHCTHLFNAMPALEHRAPGAVGALLTDGRATVEVIADGIHLHPATLRLILQTRGPRSTALVTDAMPAAGLADGQYSFLGAEVAVTDGAARLADGTLAGSNLTLDRAVRNVVALAGASWSDAIRMATLTPATIAGVADRKGALRAGADADFVALDDSGLVRQTWRAGRRVAASGPDSAARIVDRGQT